MTYKHRAAQHGEFRQPFQNGEIMTDRLAEPDAGINNKPLPGDSSFLCPCQSFSEKILNLRHHIFVVGGDLHVRRSTLHMHDYDRHLCLPDQ